MERASRLIVLVSLTLAGITHIWLVNWQPGLVAATIVTFAATFAFAHLSSAVTLAAVLATTFIAPALLAVGFGREDYHYSIVWLAALAGPLFARADVRRWHVPGDWRLPLATWAVLVAITWPIVAARELDFSLAAARTLHTTNPLLEASPRLATAFVVILAITQLVGLLWLDFLWSRFRGRAREAAQWVLCPLILSALVCATAGIYQRFVDLTWMNAHTWANLQRAGGLMLDANAFGTGVAFLAPVALATAWSLGVATPIAVATYAVLGGGMWAAGSRTALLVFSIGSAAAAVAALRERGMWRPGFGRVVALAGIVVFLVAVAVVPRDFTSSNPLERAFARVPTFDAAEIKRFATELWVRFGYGTAADAMVREHPIGGVGVGAFYVVAPQFIYRDTGRVIPPDNAQNWWRQQLAELGVLGAVPAIWVSLLIVRLCWPRPQHPEPSATALRGALIGIGIASLLGVPTQNPAIIITFGAVVFWLTHLSAGAETKKPMGIGTAGIAMLLVVALVTAALAISARGDLRVPHRAIRANVPYSYGFAPPQEVSPFGEVRWMGREALTVMPAQGRWLRLTFWAPYADVTERPIAVDLRVDGGAAGRTLQIDESGPISFFVNAASARAMMLELHASRELMPDRSLQVATSWHPDLPRDTSQDAIIARLPAQP